MDTAVAAKIENPELLMQQYKETGSRELRNQLVLHYSYIAKSVASDLYEAYSRFGTTGEIVNQGFVSLMESLEKYDPDSGINLSAYLFTKVRGGVIDYIRKRDRLPRRMRRNEIEINTAQDQLTMSLGRYPTKRELAQYLNISHEELLKRFSELAGDLVYSYDPGLSSQQTMVVEPSADDSFDPVARIDDKDMREALAKAIDSLNEQERTVISLYYYENLKLREIGKVMNVSEQRICLVKKNSVEKLRNAMSDYIKG